jgi:hypothetical protein
MILSSHGIIGSSIVQIPPVFLLNDYPGAAAAYSLRKLRSAYTGSAIEVRRTNLDVADIGFTSTGELDTTALLAFTGTGALDNGFVTKWYDQSGNARDVTQATALNQPQIVSSGSVILENGKPALQFDGSNDHLRFLGSTITSINNVSLITVSGAINNGISTQFLYTIGLPTTSKAMGLSYTSSENINLFAWGGADTTSTSSYLNQILSFATINTVNASLSVNSTNTVTNTLTSSISIEDSSMWISTRPQLVQLYLNGKCQELISYYNNQSSNRTGIETNINDFYSIY